MVSSGRDYDADVLSPENAWIAKLDHDAFKAGVRKIGKALSDQQGPADLAHLQKIIWWSRLCTMTGILSMGWRVNPISIYLLSLGTMSRWAIVGHHICHGGFDKCSGSCLADFV